MNSASVTSAQPLPFRNVHPTVRQDRCSCRNVEPSDRCASVYSIFVYWMLTSTWKPDGLWAVAVLEAQPSPTTAGGLVMGLVMSAPHATATASSRTAKRMCPSNDLATRPRHQSSNTATTYPRTDPFRPSCCRSAVITEAPADPHPRAPSRRTDPSPRARRSDDEDPGFQA